MPGIKSWWKHGVIYQIYPRSFYDSNNDGTGDIPGIIQKLDYLSDLGITGIWLSPVNTSPMYDFGYDISNYRDIEPVFGSMTDFKLLLKEAHKRNIRIIMDLVINHTSHKHPWFIEARSSRDNHRRDWYIWHDGKNGKYPNNWMASFGGHAWQWDKTTRQYYLHTFLKEQPDVNWRNPQLKNAIFDMIRFWLDNGVDGFRLDVCNWYVKDALFRSNPYMIGPYPRPYDMQKHIYDRNQSETLDIIREFRMVLDSYDERMSVGEVYCEQPGDPEFAVTYYGDGHDGLHEVFDFSILHGKWNARKICESIQRWNLLVPVSGWPCHVLNNHDNPRSISRWGKKNDATEKAKVAAAMLLTLRGTPYLYYGEEIGMKDGKIPRKAMMDPLGIKYWPFHPGRDPQRTPMQWSAQANSGFSNTKPWLPINDDYPEVNVEAELADKESLLHWYKSLIALRNENAVLQLGDWFPIIRGENKILAYERSYDGQKVFVVLNFGTTTRKVELGGSRIWKVLQSTHKSHNQEFKGLDFWLGPFEATILKNIGPPMIK